MNQKLGLLCALAGVALLGSTSQAEVIYANNVTRNANTTYWPTMLAEEGDEITLAGTARYLTTFSFEYYGQSASPGSFLGNNVGMRVRFYANDGPLVSGYPAPGTSFFDSGWIYEAGGDKLRPTSADTFIFTPGDGLPVNGLFMPYETFTFSVQFEGLGTGDVIGVSLYEPADVGSNTEDYWHRNLDNSWSALVNAEAGRVNFGSFFEASLVPVPEPASLALLFMGGLLLAMRRGRK